MKAANRVIDFTADKVPAVCIYERSNGINVAVLIVPVRTDFYETDEDAIARASRIATVLSRNV